MLSTQAKLLANPGDAERLTGKAGRKDFVIRKVLYILNIHALALVEVRTVCLAGETVDFNRIDTFAPNGLETSANTPNTRKQVNKSKRPASRGAAASQLYRPEPKGHRHEPNLHDMLWIG